MNILNDLTVRRIYAAIGKDATADLIGYIDAGGSSGGAPGGPLVDPSLTGTIRVGAGVTDKVGAFGSAPVAQPAGTDQAAIAATSAKKLTGMVGVASTSIPDVGATHDQMTLNNIVASLATQVDNAVVDLTALRTLANRIRQDLVTLGWIKGGP